MLITFGVYYEHSAVSRLVSECLHPLVKSLKAKNAVRYCYFYLDSYKGENITLWLEPENDSNEREIKESIRASTLSFLEKNPSQDAAEEFNPNRLFLHYPNNTLVFFGSAGNALQSHIDTLGEELVDELCTFAFRLVEDTAPSRENILHHLYEMLLMQYFSNSGQDLAQTERLLEYSISLERRKHNLNTEEFKNLKAEAKSLLRNNRNAAERERIILKLYQQKGLGQAEDQWVRITAEAIKQETDTVLPGKTAALINALGHVIFDIFDFPSVSHIQLLLQLKNKVQLLKKVMPERYAVH